MIDYVKKNLDELVIRRQRTACKDSAHIWPNTIHMCQPINQFKVERLQVVEIRDSRMENHHGI